MPRPYRIAARAVCVTLITGAVCVPAAGAAVPECVPPGASGVGQYQASLPSATCPSTGAGGLAGTTAQATVTGNGSTGRGGLGRAHGQSPVGPALLAATLVYPVAAHGGTGISNVIEIGLPGLLIAAVIALLIARDTSKRNRDAPAD